MSFDAYQLKEA